MFALGFVNLVFASHLSYILLERKEKFHSDKNFWLILIGLLASILITTLVFRLS